MGTEAETFTVNVANRHLAADPVTGLPLLYRRIGDNTPNAVLMDEIEGVPVLLHLDRGRFWHSDVGIRWPSFMPIAPHDLHEAICRTHRQGLSHVVATYPGASYQQVEEARRFSAELGIMLAYITPADGQIEVRFGYTLNPSPAAIERMSFPLSGVRTICGNKVGASVILEYPAGRQPWPYGQPDADALASAARMAFQISAVATDPGKTTPVFGIFGHQASEGRIYFECDQLHGKPANQDGKFLVATLCCTPRAPDVPEDERDAASDDNPDWIEEIIIRPVGGPLFIR